MRINNYTSLNEIKAEIAKRFKTYRLSLNYSQEYVSKKSGVSLRTIKSFEKDGVISLDNLIKIMKTLSVCDNFDFLIPETKLNVADLHRLGHEKQRVSKMNDKSHINWGDEQ